MRYFIIIFIGIFLSFGHAYAAIKPCKELKTEIAVKIDAAKVPSYVLFIEKNNKTKKGNRKDGGKIVGSCDGGTKKIIYINRLKNKIKSSLL